MALTQGVRPDLTLDPWYEPSHAVRLERWKRAHALATHPVVVVNAIPGLVGRLAAPERVVVDSLTTLYVERHGVNSVLSVLPNWH